MKQAVRSLSEYTARRPTNISSQCRLLLGIEFDDLAVRYGSWKGMQDAAHGADHTQIRVAARRRASRLLSQPRPGTVTQRHRTPALRPSLLL